jgi:heme-degrading monooxygenase HmoA
MTVETLFNINVFTPNPGAAERLAQAQLAGLPRLGDSAGLREGRLFRAEDGEKLILLSAFESVDAHRAFMASEPFLRHRENLLPLVASSEAAFYRQIYTRR